MEVVSLEYVDVFDANRVKLLSFSKHLLKAGFNEKSLFANIVDGQSMQPVINHKAIIVADLSQKELINDAIYLVYYENRMWVKRYNEKERIFFSINPDFAHLNYEQGSVHLVARVLLTFTNL